ncbi:MAG: PIN domain-containing protein [Bacillota bacterium]|nr:PIN domain-containing protein [Bacillota bacterium]
MDYVFVDTSAWYAYINAGDPDHGRVRSAMEELAGRLLTSNYVFDELITLVLRRLGHQAAIKVGRALLNPAEVVMERVRAVDEQKAWEFLQRRPDTRYSFTDCTSFALMQRLGLKRALALDDHFRQEQFLVLP